MKIYVATFDPITDQQIEQLKQIHKQTRKDIYLSVKGDGILTIKERMHLCIHACKPYRYMHVVNIGKDDTLISISNENEIKVRLGYYRLAAKGIRKQLLENEYYFEQIVHAQCKPQRALHSISVADTASMLADIHHLNRKLAHQMGMLHDITKNMPQQEAQQLLQHYNPEVLKLDPVIWHSYTAVLWLKMNMCCYDEKILHAIQHHTVGTGKSVYDRLLYIADKIEPTRHYDVTKHTALAKKDLKQAAQYVLDDAKAYILKKEGKHV